MSLIPPEAADHVVLWTENPQYTSVAATNFEVHFNIEVKPPDVPIVFNIGGGSNVSASASASMQP